MFGFITKMFRKKEKPTGRIVTKIPEEVKKSSQIIDPSKSKVDQDVGDMPGAVRDGQIIRDVGHVNFNNTKSITRKFNKAKLRESMEERKNSYYDDDGIIYLG
jgi:hypothetical protein